MRLRVRLDDGARSTVHVACYDRRAFAARVAVLERPAPLAAWCAAGGVRHAVVGGFFARPHYSPLGELRVAGAAVAHEPFDPPWGGVRACLQIDGPQLTIAPRNALSATPAGDLLQAGPLLVSAGRRVVTSGDAEGFSAGARQFDSDITRGRYPRAALAVTATNVLTLACDGRTDRDAGMTLTELGDTLVELGAVDALNLDGGGSASLVHNGRLRNRPREEHGVDLLGGRPVVTAVVLEPR